jgi:hypothetical protein
MLNYHGQGIVCIEKFFQELEKEKKKKNTIEAKFKVSDDEEANKFWYETFGPTVCFSFLKKKQFAVEKDKFVEEMTKKFSVVKDYMQNLFDPTSDDLVSVGDFKLFLSWFGPFENCIKNAESICEAKYFFGSMSALVCQELLDSQPIGTFLVRFNEKEPGNICISCVEEDSSFKPATLHFKVNHQNEFYYLTTSEKTEKSVQSLVDRYKLSFKIPYEDKSIKVQKIFSYESKPSDSVAKKRKMDFTYFWGPLDSKDFIQVKEEVILDIK